MTAVHYAIVPEVFARFPGYVRGVLVFEGLRNGAGDAAVAALLREAEQRADDYLPGNVADFPQVAAWRAAYRAFGAKPSEHRSSIEALLRRTAKGDILPSINTLVDIGNIISLRHGLPAGVHPLLGSADLMLRFGQLEDIFHPAEGTAGEAIPADEVVLAHGRDVLTRRWTWRQSCTTRTEVETNSVFFNVDGLPPTSRDVVEAAMQEIADLVEKFCGGRLVGRAVLDQSHSCLQVETSGS